MTQQLSNIEKIKQQLHLQQQVKEIVDKDYVDLQNMEHFQVIIEVIGKPKKQKTANDLQLLSLAFSSIKYFQEMSKTTSSDEMLNLFRELQYMEVPAKRTLFKLGDIGKNFYIILSGSVWVLVAKSGLQNGTFQKKDENSKVKVEFDEGTQPDEKEFCDLDDESMLNQKYPNLMKVGQINQGGSFGEIALTNFIPRQATIVCRENCQFISLSREAFNKFLSEYYNRIQQKNFQFLKSIQIFKNWPDAELNQMQYHLEPVEYSMSTQIYKEGEIVKGVYFILEGQVEITKTAKQEIMNDNQISKLQRSLSSKNLLLKLNRCNNGQIFGYLEIIQQQEYRHSSATCITEKAKMLFLPEDRFKLYCCHGETLDELQKLILHIEEKRRISKQIFLGHQGSFQYNSLSILDSLSGSPSLLVKTLDDDIDTVQSQKSRYIQIQNQALPQRNSERKGQNNKNQKIKQNILGKIQHQPQNIQNYYDFLHSQPKEKSQFQLSFDFPLIEIEQSRKAKVLQQQLKQQYSISKISSNSQSIDSRICIIQSLKLPKIFKKSKNREDVQLQVFKFVRQHNSSVDLS